MPPWKFLFLATENLVHGLPLRVTSPEIPGPPLSADSTAVPKEPAGAAGSCCPLQLIRSGEAMLLDSITSRQPILETSPPGTRQPKAVSHTYGPSAQEARRGFGVHLESLMKQSLVRDVNWLYKALAQRLHVWLALHATDDTVTCHRNTSPDTNPFFGRAMRSPAWKF